MNAALAKRVRKAVEELEYTPDTRARSLVSGRSRMLGLIVTLITNPFYPELIQSFENLAADRGYDILIGSTNYEPNRKLTCIQRMLDRRVDGVADMTFGANEELLQSLAKHKLPLVSVGPSAVSGVLPVTIDFRIGIHEAVQHLAVLGHRRFAFISGPLRVDNSYERQVAFLEATRRIGVRVPVTCLIEGDHSMETGFSSAERIIALPERPTAILCSNDMTAIGVLHATSAHQLRVPDDVSVVGFDDIHMAQFTVPPLSSVRMSCDEVARSALDLLIATIEGQPIQPAPPLATRLIVRESTGYAPSAVNGRKLGDVRRTTRKTAVTKAAAKRGV